MKQDFPQEPIDPRLISTLNLLKETPQRDPEAVEKNKHKFLSELESLPLPEKGPSVFKQFLGMLGFVPDNDKKKGDSNHEFK